VTALNGRPVLVAVAAQIGDARLIDNILIKP
jgi:pantothenate synthetase